MKNHGLRLLTVMCGLALSNSLAVQATEISVKNKETANNKETASAQQIVSGRAAITSRIIDGKDTEVNAYPFMTGLISYSAQDINPFCGASFIGGRYVLSASHCLEGDNSDLGVWIGGHDVTNPAGGRKVKAQRVYLHENYSGVSLNNDIAIIELEEEVTDITPILPLTPEIEATLEEGFEFTVMGWGNTDTSENGPVYPNVLQEVNVPLYNRAQCLTDYTREGETESDITEQMLCAGLVEGGKDSCQGDSGGPLVFSRDGQWYQVGVVSFGNGCAAPNAPGIYARVSQFNDWIDAKKAGVSYEQIKRNGYVEQEFDETVVYEIKNVGDTEFSVTGIEVSETTNLTPVTIAENGCNSGPLSSEQTCDITLNVKADQAGDSAFTLNVSTDNPRNTLAQMFFQMNVLEQESLAVAELTGSPDLIRWWGGGTANWVAQTNQVDSGDNALSSGDITDFENSVLLATVEQNRTSTLALKYLVSSEEGYDFLTVQHNGNLVLRASGTAETTFQNLSIELPAGKNRIAIEYAKDSTELAGDDKAYVDTISLTLQNAAPVAAVAQESMTVGSGATVTLDASSSTDADMDTLSYQWTQVANDAPQVTIDNATSAEASFTAPEVSTDTQITFEVTVTDTSGSTSMAQVQVTVQAPAPAPAPAPTPAPAPQNSSSGGSTSGILAVCMALMVLRRFTYSRLRK